MRDVERDTKDEIGKEDGRAIVGGKRTPGETDVASEVVISISRTRPRNAPRRANGACKDPHNTVAVM